MLAINQIRYTPMGQSMGVDLNSVLGLIDKIPVDDPKTTIEKVMLLSVELIKNGN